MEFKNLLCVLTATHRCDDVLSHAVHLAERYQAKLNVLLALDSLPPNANMIMESANYVDSKISIEEQARTWLNAKVAEWNERYPIDGQVTIGNPLAHIEEATQGGVDLVIKQASDDLLDRLFGTDDMHLVQTCASPVLLTHHKLPHQYKHILVAVDANYHYPPEEAESRKRINHQLVAHGLQIAQRENAQCHIVSVFDVYPPALLGDGFIVIPQDALEDEAQVIAAEQREILDELVANYAPTLTPKVHVVQGNPRSELAALANNVNADLVVMGTVARTGISGLLIGNTADAIISQLNCAVLTFKTELG
ncbi:universal stress protein UspA [Alteromonas sediminis]|uniref:Universal stress protein UspA n=1 Tax=Alteromonas sediminis TaxID=2259342 RepID=A0A3N5Y404_9ALTE|nr:universal stress protein [Alteromonas sediminis]RPJ68140.1 universal stress protein UspA [Alteromonas sediminis]